MDTQIAIIADVRASRRLGNFPDLRDRALSALSKAHRAQAWLDSEYAITAWDEFSGLVVQPAALPKVLWDLYRTFEPMKLRIGIGGGAVERHRGESLPINESATGEAFFLAREALQSLEVRRQRTGAAAVAVRWNQPAVEYALNAALRPLDVIVAALTETQWVAIGHYEATGRQDETARALGKSESTISRTLATARYWDIRTSLEDVTKFLQAYGW